MKEHIKNKMNLIFYHNLVLECTSHIGKEIKLWKLYPDIELHFNTGYSRKEEWVSKGNSVFFGRFEYDLKVQCNSYFCRNSWFCVLWTVFVFESCMRIGSPFTLRRKVVSYICHQYPYHSITFEYWWKTNTSFVVCWE